VLELEWYRLGIRATIDKAGRLVIPKPLRDRVGLRPGEVEVTVDGAGLRVEPLAGDALEERGGRLVIPSAGAEIDDELVRTLRDAGQR
jgi:AbrB family looped-hinge helix DNA binding protein